jgi:hypothetical protein
MLDLEPAPGYIVGKPREQEPVSDGGIILPSGGVARLPIVTVIRDGGPPHGECEQCADAREKFAIEPGDDVVVAGLSQVLELGLNSLLLIPYSAVIAKVRWTPK